MSTAGTAEDAGEQAAAQEWADMEAAKIGLIWLRRFPAGKDWAEPPRPAG